MGQTGKVHYGLVGGHQAATPIGPEEMSRAIDPIYPNLPVDRLCYQASHLSNVDIRDW